MREEYQTEDKYNRVWYSIAWCGMTKGSRGYERREDRNLTERKESVGKSLLSKSWWNIINRLN